MASPTSPDLTRHQLDELDALLQRMLNLPLAPAPQPAPVPPPPTAPVVPVAAIVLPAHWDEPQADVVPFTEPRTLRGVDAPATPVGFTPVAFAEPDLVDLAAAPPAPVDAPRTVPLVLWPLAATNAVIESGLGLAGPLGAWVASPGAKTVWGMTGVAMLVAAGLWAARGAGHLG